MKFGSSQLRSAQNREDSSNTLQRNAVCCTFLKFGMVKFITRKDDELALILILLNHPTGVSNLVVNELVQRRAFNIDGLRNNSN